MVKRPGIGLELSALLEGVDPCSQVEGLRRDVVQVDRSSVAGRDRLWGGSPPERGPRSCFTPGSNGIARACETMPV